MTKLELVKHLRTSHGMKLEYEHRVTVAVLTEWHHAYHVEERRLSDAFIAKQRKP